MPRETQRTERLAKGLCAQCGTRELAKDRTRCERCLAICRKLAAEQRRWCNRANKCQACLRRKQAKGRGRRCKQCADFYLVGQRERERAQRASEREREQEKAS